MKKTIQKNLNQKIFIFLLLFILLFLFHSISLISQTALCYKDCDTNIWVPAPGIPPYTIILTLPCGEQVILSYRIRRACNLWWDLYMENIEFVNGNYGGENCGLTMSTPAMIENCIEQLLVKNPMNFPPLDSNKDTCNTTIRVNLSACWYPTFFVARDSGNASHGNRMTTDKMGGGLIIPCLSTQCCYQAYKVCYALHKKIITYLGGSSNPGQCEPNQPPFCIPICN